MNELISQNLNVTRCYYCGSKTSHLCHYSDDSGELIHLIGVCQSTVCIGKIPSGTTNLTRTIKLF